MPRKVVVVDDTRNVQMMLSDFLSSQDFDVLTAADGRQALDLVQSASPDLILLDIMMPGISGLEVALLLPMVVPAFCDLGIVGLI